MTTVVMICGVLSSILTIYCGIPYIRSILSGRTKPHQFSFLVFSIMNGIVTISQLLEGGTWSVLLSATLFGYNVLEVPTTQNHSNSQSRSHYRDCNSRNRRGQSVEAFFESLTRQWRESRRQHGLFLQSWRETSRIVMQYKPWLPVRCQ